MNRLIIIGGLARSGTSWLGNIFDSHPATAYRSEPDNYPQLQGVPLFPPADMAASAPVSDFVYGLPALNRYRHTAKPPIFRKSYRSPLADMAYRTSASLARHGNRFSGNMPVWGARVSHVDPAPIMVWKTVRSLGRCGLLLRSLPEARLVHLVRHPCGQIASVLRGERESRLPDRSSEYYSLFRELLETEQGQRHGITLDYLRRLTPEERLAWHWLLINEKAADEAEGSGRAQLIRYEDICAAPVDSARQLFRFAGLDWNSQTEAFLQRSTTKGNNRYFSVFKNPAKTANRWRQELDRGSIERIMAVVSRSSTLSGLYGPRKDMAGVA